MSGTPTPDDVTEPGRALDREPAREPEPVAEAATDASSAVEGPPRLWPGLVAWAIVCAVYLGLEVGDVVDGLAIPVPLIAMLVIGRALDLRPGGHRIARACAIGVVSVAVVLLLLAWRYRHLVPALLSTESIATLASGVVFLMLALVRPARIRLLRALGLNPDSAVHVVVAITVGVTLVLSVVLFADLQAEPDEALPFDITDPLVSVLSDGALALAGVGLLLSRGLRDSLARLDLRLIRLPQVAMALALTVVFHAGVALMEHAESLWLPDVHAREDRFGYEFVGIPPVVGAALVSLAAGVGEELVFRGALQPRLGIVLTSLVFAALHVQYQVPGMVMIFLVGVALGLLKRRTSTTFTVCVHVFYDMGAFLLPDV